MKFLYLFEEFVNEVKILGKEGVIPLSKVNKEAAKKSINKGDMKNDKVDGWKTTKDGGVPVNKLKASQTEIIPEKAVGMALGVMLSKDPVQIGGDLGSIISEDNFIMDGHHRWAASYLCDPNSKVVATRIKLPGTALVSVLNTITTGLFNRKGNPGKGDIKQFTGAVIGPIIDKFLTEGIGGDYPITKENIKIYLGRVPGANGDSKKGKEIMMKNADALPKDIMPGAPARVEMPVIGEKEVEKVKNMLKSGKIDIKEPHNVEVQKEIDKGKKPTNPPEPGTTK